MTPHLEFGLGLILGFLATVFLFWGFNWLRSKKLLSSKDALALIKTTERVLDEVDAPCMILDANANIIFANQTARELDGTTELYSQVTAGLTQTRVLESITSDRVQTIDPHENENTLRLRIVPLNTNHALVLVSDTSAQARIIAMRRDFITNMSHELKTPLAAISLLSEALAKAAEDPSLVKKFSAKLQKETHRLNDLSRDVIKLSEAQAPIAKEERSIFDLAETVKRAVSTHADLAQRNGVNLELTGRIRKRSTLVNGRQTAIDAAVSNLITNAIEHSPAGETVTVDVKKIKSDCFITVIDRGPGIAAEHQERIFERFFRADESRSRSLGGSGLGLSIVRNAARTHAGDVTVNSTPGEGAAFKMRIPLTKLKGEK